MKIIKVLASVIVLVIAIAVLMLNFAAQPEAFVVGSHSAKMLEPGPYEVASFSEVLVDASRATQANKDAPAKEERSLDTMVWYPLDGSAVVAGRHPLVVYSHGFSSMKDGGAYIAEHLASHGYVVISASFPLTNFNAPGGPMVKDVVNQPGDVSFLIDTVLAWSADSEHMLANSIDAERIGATGISLGGMTTTLATFHPEQKDDRIKVAASIAGPLSMFGQTFFAHKSMPFLMLAADIDALVDYQANAVPVLDKIAGSQLVTITGGSHTGFVDPARYLRWMDNPDSIGCKQVLGNIDADDEPWYDLLGTPEQGIVEDPAPALCSNMPLPEAANPLRQHMITRVVILSFFQSYFAASDEEKIQYQQYLAEHMARELDDVSTAFSPL